MKKNTRKTRTLALTLALCLALVCFAPAALVCASTDFELPEVFPYEHVYYFSDMYIGEVDTYFAKISSELTVRYLNVPYLHKCPYSLTESDYSPYRYEVEENSVVIFEKTTWGKGYAALTDTNDTLSDLFSSWRSDGCKVIFVNGVEESRLLGLDLDYDTSPYTEFLEYVDIHINTDIFTIFMDNILRIHFDYGPIDNFLFVLDESLGKDWLEFIKSWVFEEYIFKYMIMTDKYGMNEVTDLFDYFEKRNINFLFYDGSSLDSLYEATEFWNESNMCAIGTNRLGNEYAEQWLYDMIELREMKNENFAIYEYLYPVWSEGISEYFDSVKMAWHVRFPYLDEFWSIFDAVIRDGDLIVFDNWYGRSSTINFKPLVGEGGWMRFAPSRYWAQNDDDLPDWLR
mgnify:CR=1 FL=1